MEEVVTVWYGVYGDAVVFPVKINRHASVYELLQAIFVARYTDFFKCAPSDVTLRLARKNNAWVKRDNKAGELLRGEPDSEFEKMDLWRKLSDDAYFGKDFQPGDGHLHILVERPTEQPASATKQGRYKTMSTEASCRKFLDAIARKLGRMYIFECWYSQPTIGAVLAAISTSSWKTRKENGVKVTEMTLPDIFSDEEWRALEYLNKLTTNRIHNAKVPKTKKGNAYIILPHGVYNDDLVKTIKDIATKGNLVFEPTDFTVKEEHEFSGSSSSGSDA